MADEIVEINSFQKFNELKNGNKPIVVDYYTTWCPPCKMIAEPYKDLSKNEKYKGRVTFVKVNCEADGAIEVATAEQITAYPTFRAYLNGKMIDEVRGAVVTGLTKLVDKALNAVAQPEY